MAITGGGGFVGKALIRALRGYGVGVVSVSRGNYPELQQIGVNCVNADISKDTASLTEAFRGADCVFHVASKVAMWGRFEDFYQTNVVGTQNVIAACRAAGVPNLVYTSSPSVIASGADLKGVNETVPYPTRFKAFYPKTKALAEQTVLASNSPELRTIALRPHLIWGPGDTNLIPTIVNRARAGKLVQVGRGENLVDTTYIEDCVAAHLLAYAALENNSRSRGRAYFISQGAPVNLWEWIGEILEFYKIEPIKKKVPVAIAQFLAGGMELISLIRPGMPEPRFTRFLVSEMATDHYFDISNARTDLGYEPSPVSIADGLGADSAGSLLKTESLPSKKVFQAQG